MTKKNECLGCKIAKGLVPPGHIIYENEHICCTLDIAPFNEGHLLILPKQHFHDIDEIDIDTQIEINKATVNMIKLIKKVFKPHGVTTCANGGRFNELGHYHLHIIPRYKGDGFTWSEPIDNKSAENYLEKTKDLLINNLSN
ncbi:MULTISPECIES: HIT family protein [Bacillaceae]|uniref:HIT family hydrolase n=2 Tax=Bacillaceae TaxID=186817 RepID=A0A0V8JHA4_9BACI|nr:MULTISPECIES: HIT family protein [Bacillaceae]KSU86417.1 HIT family hydrolase [Priestia veravalensis]MBZ9534280.1 HIT family protein [Cytobacillus oceanisediminis]MCG7315138.1 HIT family protein [Priestia flexa]MEC0665381.1 HIT family protein [Priestia flexa]MED3823568.1 HIT family protein [Priestia flexa]